MLIGREAAALLSDRKGMSAEALKAAAAILLALAVFSVLALFATGPQRAESSFSAAGVALLDSAENSSREILAYGQTGT